MQIISGMHRSGTSLMGQLIFSAGVDMGGPETFRPADRWNRSGYYEQADVKTLNKALLHGSFGKLVYYWLPTTRTIMKRTPQHAAQLRNVSRKYQKKVVKEPRFCLTLPAWIAAGAEIDRMIICLREPIQVAQSIRRRNHALIWHGLQLWYIHNKRLLENIGDIPVKYVRYSHIINPNTRIAELSHAFRFLGHDCDTEQISALMAKRVKPELRNHNQTVQTYSKPIQQLWDDLCARHRAQFE